MTRVASAVYFTALAIWVGGLCVLAFIVAPTLFSLTDRMEAGRLFGPTLRNFGWVGLGCGVLVGVTGVILHLRERGRWGPAVKLTLIALMILLMVVQAFGIDPQVAEEGARVRRLPPGDPGRAEFDRLHRWSVRLVGATILCGFALLILSGATVRR